MPHGPEDRRSWTAKVLPAAMARGDLDVDDDVSDLGPDGDGEDDLDDGEDAREGGAQSQRLRCSARACRMIGRP